MTHQTETFSFGPFRLERGARRLVEGDREVRLGSRALELLLMLVERSGTVVPKEELVARVWPTTIVDEASLRVHIGALRKALGDGRDGARYITNIPGRGYSFVARVDASTPIRIGVVEQRQHNLPVRLTRLVGRADAVKSVADLLRRTRFVSVVGPGGMGKTTVALAVAEEALATNEGEVRFVDLAVTADADLVTSVVAEVLGISVNSSANVESITAQLRGRRMLLVLDNCEHVLDVAARLAVGLIRAEPGIQVIATSREPLREEGELVYRLGPLDYPEAVPALDAATALRFAGVQLLVERVRGNNDAFVFRDADAVHAAELCRRLDGIPLAIEFAAVHVGHMGLSDLVARMDDSLRLLSNGRRTAFPRHQTLRALLDWSYRLLKPRCQHLLTRLAVFTGSFTMDAATEVTRGGAVDAVDVPNLMSDLVAKSLVLVDLNREVTRYRLLETTRNYALERLGHGDERKRLESRLLGVLVRQLLNQPDDWDGMTRRDWMRTYGPFLDDVRASVQWAFGPNGEPVLGATLTAAATPLAHRLSILEEYRTWVARALEELDRVGHVDPNLKLRLLVALSSLAGQTRTPWSPSECAHLAFVDELAMSDLQNIESDALQDLWMGIYGSGNYPAALNVADRIDRLAHAHCDRIEKLHADRMRAQTLHLLGRHEESSRLAHAVLDDPTEMRQVGSSVLAPFDRRVSMGIVLSRIAFLQGHADDAYDWVDRALFYAGADMAYVKCHALAFAACPIALWAGDARRAEHAIDELQDHAMSHALGHWDAWASNYRSVLEGTGRLRFPDEDHRQRDMFSTFGYFDDRTLARAQQGTVVWCRPEVYRLKAEQVLGSGAPGCAETSAGWLRAALEDAERQGALAWEVRAATSYARHHASQGPGRCALEGLRSVLARVSADADTVDVMEARALLQHAA